VPLAEVRYADGQAHSQISLYQERVAAFTLEDNDALLTSAPADSADRYRKFTLYPGRDLWLCDAAQLPAEVAEKALRGDERFIYCLDSVVRHYAKEFIGVQETRVLMDAMEQDYAELVKEVQRQLPLGKIADILQRLVEENVSIRDLRTIFETLIIWSVKEKDPVVLTEYVRSALRRHIIHRYTGDAQWMDVWVIGDAIEERVREAIRQTSAGTYLALEPEQATRIIDQIKNEMGDIQHGVLITAIDIRRYLRKLIEREMVDVDVVSFQEIGDAIELNVLGNIELIGEAY
jgi:type III secretion protein V